MRCLIGMLVFIGVTMGRASSPAEAYRDVDPDLLAQVRQGFETAPDSASRTRELIDQLDGSLPSDPGAWPPVLRAYRAALEGLLGKHSLRPWTKYNRTRAALARWPGLVEAHPESIEMRLLRYSFASQLPDFFDRGAQAEADLSVLIDLLERAEDPTVTPDYRREAIRWILQNGTPAPEQRHRLEELMLRDESAIE